MTGSVIGSVTVRPGPRKRPDVVTTIAYRDGVLAADTLMTANGMRAGDQVKIMRRGRLIIGFAGASRNFEAFRNWLASGATGAFSSEDGNVFIIPPDGCPVVWGDGDTPWRETAPFWALGTGEAVAMGAMQAGSSAEDAVRAAIALDVNSGGEITVLHR